MPIHLFSVSLSLFLLYIQNGTDVLLFDLMISNEAVPHLGGVSPLLEFLSHDRVALPQHIMYLVLSTAASRSPIVCLVCNQQPVMALSLDSPAMKRDSRVSSGWGL